MCIWKFRDFSEALAIWAASYRLIFIIFQANLHSDITDSWCLSPNQAHDRKLVCTPVENPPGSTPITSQLSQANANLEAHLTAHLSGGVDFHEIRLLFNEDFIF